MRKKPEPQSTPYPSRKLVGMYKFVDQPPTFALFNNLHEMIERIREQQDINGRTIQYVRYHYLHDKNRTWQTLEKF